ncbi:YbaK/EbsC family protein [Streptomyces sp. CRN 30]|uniref:YbaK/EbsC family protein n=1 Tax=Streptomyces sp. CRN 30 TaxID=3075613 RepID=UPI002A7EB6E9|nr:YbaK/EbsC family protein [Streptomyces sp. CRN 30]
MALWVGMGKMGQVLNWLPLDDARDLVAQPVYERLTSSLDGEELRTVEVAEIDVDYAAGDALCEHYGVPWEDAANCLLISAVRGPVTFYAACLMRPGSRSDLNGAVRRFLGARQVKMMSRDQALELSAMEYGSITAVGLPKEWRVLVDSGFESSRSMVMGSGLLRSKLRISMDSFCKATGGEFVPGLTRA